MNWPSWLLWGFVSTLLLSTLEAATQELGLTRVDLPYMLGTMVTPDRDRAKLYGFFIHLMNGLVFSLLYVLIFRAWGDAGWWRGMLLGLGHAAFVLLVIMQLLPGVHPRMASELRGPTASRQLEPPGKLGLNYGLRTPLSIILSHALFGAILGTFYHLPGT